MNAITLRQGCSLTELEWSVVEIARFDDPRSINPDGRFTRFVRRFLGLHGANPLANEKLERLRSFCVRAWFRDRIPSRDARALMEAGYTSGDIFQILAHVAALSGVTPSIEAEGI